MQKPPGFTLGELAVALGAARVGDPGRRVNGVAARDAAGPAQL